MNSKKIFGGIDVFICISSGEIDTSGNKESAVCCYNI